MLDPDSPEGPEVHSTEVVINEQSPRFRAKFDFVYISATSMLTLTVFEKAGMWDSVMKFGKKVCGSPRCASPPCASPCLVPRSSLSLHTCSCGAALGAIGVSSARVMCLAVKSLRGE